MNIGIVCYPTFGGSGVVATELGKALARQGHKVHFITYAQPVRLVGSLRKNIFYHEVSVSDYPLFEYQPYELVLTSKMVDVALHENLDVLHVHYAIPHASAAIMAREILKEKGKYVPIVTTLHGTDITLVGKDESFEPVITHAINKSDAVTSVSESLKQDTYKYFGVTNEIKVIPNFICPENLESRREEIEGIRSNYARAEERILIHISNFRAVKRVEDVVKVFAKVQQRVPAKLIFVGDGPDRIKAEAKCRELGVCDKVFFLGRLKNPTEALFMSDLFLLTSETESFGLAALEAMAIGVPVVSSNTGGIPEVNKHGVSGLLSEVGDIEDMAKNAISILKTDEALAAYKQGAKEQSELFNLKKILPEYEHLYSQLLVKNPS
ncbi:N-acetyl-alpha-D-glucosaminyl L-malate synthase BshA [Luteibaculum oceani]|uniref:N-acetyl-alpha-D-glucosaminyl L-malate synthase BshA n=1 Tax=Luteibaculum oceani TaxID=1294296 RepID=A0A5C6UZ37_9FLAO|nr:N-acetyl-alpha-D-glucosaminyl L-malate synthase BshA [Luteibaculum oceani]TXC78682.1 N-acetyl-alpha-D-glucosaminyl L-malate synthase BshA [Luteibaculum oceani]